MFSIITAIYLICFCFTIINFQQNNVKFLKSREIRHPLAAQVYENFTFLQVLKSYNLSDFWRNGLEKSAVVEQKFHLGCDLKSSLLDQKNLGKWVPGPNYQEKDLLDYVRHFYNPNSTQNTDMSGNNLIKWEYDPTKSDSGLKIYTTQEIKSCLSTYFLNILLIGDSRTRQYYSALKSLLQNSYVMFDSAWQIKKYNLDQLDNLLIRQDWIVKYSAGQATYNLGPNAKKSKNLNFQPNLIIISNVILHYFYMSGLETSNLTIYQKLNQSNFWPQTMETAQLHFQEFFNNFLSAQFLMKDKSKMDSNPVQNARHMIQESKCSTSIIILAAELIQPEVEKFDHQRNIYIQKFNSFVEHFVQEKNNSRVKFIKFNLQTYQGLHQGEYLLPDRFHLAKKDNYYVIPSPLLVNFNFIFNLLCP